MIEKVQIKTALCDARLADELQSAKSDSILEQILLFGESELEKMMSGKPEIFENFPTAADDTRLIAFTSGTTGNPQGTMHFQRDMLTICRAYSEPILAPTPLVKALVVLRRKDFMQMNCLQKNCRISSKTRLHPFNTLVHGSL